MRSDYEKIITETEKILQIISEGSTTISNKAIRDCVKKWMHDYYGQLGELFDKKTKELSALEYLKRTWTNKRLLKRYWLKNLRTVLKGLKLREINGIKIYKPKEIKGYTIFNNSLLKKIKKEDKKIFQLGSEANYNWKTNFCWNSCGILMRIILERTLDRKHPDVKKKTGLKNKINFCLSNNIFGKSVTEAIKKLDNSTKITGDIVSHDSNILLDKNDIEIAIVPLNILIKDVFRL